jgi:hypothetical protein
MKVTPRLLTQLGIWAAIFVLVVNPPARYRAAFAANPEPKPTQQAAGPKYIDMAICLDTSNSMDGLIESAKQKLWAIVNELATATPKPVLRVALYQYGNNGLHSETGWVQKVSDLTDDLDGIYGKLFALRTNGGDEYVARVTRAAIGDLDWRRDGRPLKIIVVAGNEPATQDPQYKLEDICRAAAEKGITINTIFCGNESEGATTGWADAARWTDGKYAAINADKGTVVINTPYDKKLAELSSELNKTYLAYGAAGKEAAANQTAQDKNAAVASAPAAAQRAVAKSSALYRNERWDLCDACQQKDFDLAKVPDADLPAEMRGMTLEQKKAYVAKQQQSRCDLQKQIGELNTKRDEAVKQELAKKGLNESTAFDAVLRGAVREQAEKNGFQFEKK